MASITQLEYILAVAQHRHFGAAASAIPVSQPTLSQQIQKVEESFGIKIFDRLKKPVVLTVEGEAFLKQARVIVREHRRLMDLARQDLGQPSGELRLAVIPTVASALVPRFVGNFSKKFPKISLTLDELQTETILEELRQDRLDVAILATPLGQSGVLEEPLYYEKFLLYLSSNHPLTKKTTVTQSDLDGSEMWLLGDGHCFKDQVVKFCSIKRNQFSILKNVNFKTGNLETLRSLVQHGTGYTLIPAGMAMGLSREEIAAQVRNFKSPAPAREISLVFRRDYWKQHLISALKLSILESLPRDLDRQKSKGIQVLSVC